MSEQTGRSNGASGHSPYLPPPENSFSGWYHKLLMRFTYDIWRRELRRWDTWSANPDPRILECGCGPGFLLQFLGEWFPEADLLGLDTDLELLEVARERNQRLLRVLSASAEEIPLSSSSVDVLVTLHMVEHLLYPLRFLDEAERVLKPGALFVVATPNPTGIGASVMGRDWHGWRDDHVSLHAPDFWRMGLEQRGFRILKEGTTGLSGIPLLRTLPIALIQWIPLFIFGFFAWRRGESYVVISSKRGSR